MNTYNAEILKIVDETHNVKTFEFKVLNLSKDISFAFKPGQYALIMNEKRDESGNITGVNAKPFTMANNFCSEHESVYFTIKKNNEFTTDLFSSKVGDILKIRGPIGAKITFDTTFDKDVVFIAGGSGITPFKSIAEYAIHENMNNNFYLFFSNKTNKDIIYKNFLDSLSKKDNFNIINSLTSVDKEEIGQNNWGSKYGEETGRINIEIIKKYIKNNDLNNKLWYICGPPGMVDSTNKMLINTRINQNDIIFEKW